MQELIRQLFAEISGSWRFRWLAILVAWIACMVGWAVVHYLPDTYESEATVYVDTSSALRPLLQQLTIDTDVMEQVELVATAMLGRPQLEKVARETDLYLRAESEAEMDALVASMRDRIRISNNTRVDPNFYSIAYRDVNRQMAQAVVARLLNNFVEDSLGEDRQENQRAQRFLRQELTTLEQELTKSEQELAEFKKKNVGRMPGTGGDYFERLQDEITALDKTRSSLRLAERKREALRQQLSGEQPVLDGGIGPKSEIDERISQHRKRLEELQLRFTDLHPDIIAVKATLEQLQEQKAEIVSELNNTDGVGQASDNPVYQNIQIELTNVNVEIAGLREEEQAQVRKITQLRELIDVLPQVEAELARLTRDYDVKQTQYQNLLQRLEVAKLSQSAEQSEDVKFRIIDPPILPESPAAPNRPLLLTFVLLAGLGLGGGVAFMGNQISPVFSDVTAVRQVTTLPVLGAVTAMSTAVRRKQRLSEIWMLCGSVFALCVVFVVMFLLQNQGGRLFQSVG